MHNKDKYPEIWAVKEKAEKELAPLLAARKKHTDTIASIQKEISNLNLQKQSLNDEAMKDADRIIELRGEVARMAKAMGAVTSI